MKIYNLNEMLPLLGEFKKIIVTGPQRSGTTVASKIIAHELKVKWIREESIGVDRLDLFFKMHFSQDSYVLQCPALSFACHLLPVDAVIFMWREDDEIRKSAERIDWMEYDKYESAKYFNLDVTKPSWIIKKHAFVAFQVDKIKNVFTLSYSSLDNHPLYVDADHRRNFHSRQTEISESIQQVDDVNL